MAMAKTTMEVDVHINKVFHDRVNPLLLGRCWAIMPDRAAALAELMQVQAQNAPLSAQEINDRLGSRASESQVTVGAVAVLPVYGILSHRARSFFGISTEELGLWFDEWVADDDIRAIVLDVDSPGGSVHGLQELSDKIYHARSLAAGGQGTKIVAVANSLAASAAYYIATAADELVVTPGGLVGSVGTIGIHTEFSKMLDDVGIKPTIIFAGQHKKEGNALEPLTDDAHDDIQRIVDEYYAQFVKDVARNRGVKTSVVEANFGQGRVYGGADAVKRGMADRVATLEEVIAGLREEATPKGPSAEFTRRRGAMGA